MKETFEHIPSDSLIFDVIHLPAPKCLIGFCRVIVGSGVIGEEERGGGGEDDEEEAFMAVTTMESGVRSQMFFKPQQSTFTCLLLLSRLIWSR